MKLISRAEEEGFLASSCLIGRNSKEELGWDHESEVWADLDAQSFKIYLLKLLLIIHLEYFILMWGISFF